MILEWLFTILHDIIFLLLYKFEIKKTHEISCVGCIGFMRSVLYDCNSFVIQYLDKSRNVASSDIALSEGQIAISPITPKPFEVKSDGKDLKIKNDNVQIISLDSGSKLGVNKNSVEANPIAMEINKISTPNTYVYENVKVNYE